MRLGSPTPHRKARIEIIPLIDIMFFLLASFMLVSLSLVKLQGAKVNLPSAGKPFREDIQKPDFTTVSVDKDGKIFWTKNNAKAKEEINIDELAARARALFGENKESKVYINADTMVYYGSVLRVMERLRNAGLTKVTFALKPPSREAASGPPPGGH